MQKQKITNEIFWSEHKIGEEINQTPELKKKLTNNTERMMLNC